MFHAFFLSLVVIFIAELGDKSQLMALAFATRYKTVPVLIGITLATALVHLASVGIGAVLGAALPTRPINAVAALAFVGFGLWTLRGDELTDDDTARANKTAKHVVIAVGMVIADALAIVVGRAMGARLPERTIKIGAALTFFFFAVLLGYEAIAG